jgi:uncharacterized protein
MNTLANILIAAACVYVLFGLFLFLSQKNLIYYPDRQDFTSCDGFIDYEKVNYNGTRFYYRNASADSVIIHYHGNAGSACDRSAYRPTLESPGASVIFVEYAGYSSDKRRPSRSLILNDVKNIREFAKKQAFKKIILYGESIGTGAASYHASIGGADSIILVSPFSSMTDVAQSKYLIYPAILLLREKFDNTAWLKGFNGKVLILHGKNDYIIPPRFSKKLFNELETANKEYVLLEGRGHNDLWESNSFKDRLRAFIVES